MKKRKLLVIMIVTVCLLTLTVEIGRFYVKNFTAFSWETTKYQFEGNKEVRIKLKNRGGYDLSGEFPATISRGDKRLCLVYFQSDEQHRRLEALFQDVMQEPTTGRRNGREYYFCSDQSEHNWEYGTYLREIDLWVKVRGDVSREVTQDCFERMTISCRQWIPAKTIDGQAQNLNVFYDFLKENAELFSL